MINQIRLNGSQKEYPPTIMEFSKKIVRFDGNTDTYSLQSLIDGYYSLNSKAATILADSQIYIANINNKILKQNAEEFLNAFVKELFYFDPAPNIFPKINVEIENDNVFFEWVFNVNFRMGFTIVDNDSDSSWFLFLKNNEVAGSFSGTFEREYRFTIRKLLKIAWENT